MNPQPLAALQSANVNRLAKVDAVRAIRTGKLSILDAISDPPEALHGVLIPNLLLEAPRFGRGKLRHVGKRATWANVNLLLPLGDAPAKTREWLVQDLSARTRVRS